LACLRPWNVPGILESLVAFSTPKMPAVVSKRGVLMGTIKVGAFSSRRKKATDMVSYSNEATKW